MPPRTVALCVAEGHRMPLPRTPPTGAVCRHQAPSLAPPAGLSSAALACFLLRPTDDAAEVVAAPLLMHLGALLDLAEGHTVSIAVAELQPSATPSRRAARPPWS